jgi:hypothetical protein
MFKKGIQYMCYSATVLWYWEVFSRVIVCQRVLTVNFCQPDHKFTFGVAINFKSYPLVLTPLI